MSLFSTKRETIGNQEENLTGQFPRKSAKRKSCRAERTKKSRLGRIGISNALVGFEKIVLQFIQLSFEIEQLS